MQLSSNFFAKNFPANTLFDSTKKNETHCKTFFFENLNFFDTYTQVQVRDERSWKQLRASQHAQYKKITINSQAHYCCRSAAVALVKITYIQANESFSFNLHNCIIISTVKIHWLTKQIMIWRSTNILNFFMN